MGARAIAHTFYTSQLPEVATFFIARISKIPWALVQ